MRLNGGFTLHTLLFCVGTVPAFNVSKMFLIKNYERPNLGESNHGLLKFADIFLIIIINNLSNL